MGRYVYQPLIMDKYDEELYLKNYIKSIRTGELLVDLTNYDIFVTEEGIELPIPITKNLREAVIGYVKGLGKDFNTRFNYLLKYSDKIQQIINKLKLEDVQDIAYKEGFPGKVNQGRSVHKFYENLTIENLENLGMLTFSSEFDNFGNESFYNNFSKTSEEYYKTYLKLEKYYADFNNLLFEIKSANGLIGIRTDLQNLWTQIQNTYKDLNLLVPNGQLGYLNGTMKLYRKTGYIKTITVETDVFDFAYMPLALSSRDSYYNKDCWFFHNHPYTSGNGMYDLTVGPEGGAYNLAKYFTNLDLRNHLYVTYERNIQNRDIQNGLTPAGCGFRYGNGFVSSRGIPGNPGDTINFRGGWRYSRRSYGTYPEHRGQKDFRTDYYGTGGSEGGYYHSDEVCKLFAEKNEYGIWVPNEIYYHNIEGDKKYHPEHHNFNYDAVNHIKRDDIPWDQNNINSRLAYAYAKNGISFISCSTGTGSNVAQSNAPYNSAGNFNTWRMTKICIVGRTTVSTTINTVKEFNASFNLPLKEPKTF